MIHNGTHPCWIEVNASEYLLIPVSILSLLLVFKGLFVIIMTFRCPELQGTVNFVFASMAANDLVISVALFYFQLGILPFNILVSLKTKIITCFILGDSYGTIVVFLMHLLLLAVDRYLHVLHPLYFMRYVTKRRIFLALLCVWTSGLVAMFIPLITYIDDKYHVTCILLQPPIVYFSVISSVYIVILLAVFFCYFKIAHLAFTRRKATNIRLFNMNSTGQTAIFRSNQTPALRCIKFFIVMFGIFALASLPLVITTWLSYLYNVPNIMLRVAFLLIPVYLLFNIFNYVKVNRNFSRVLRSTFSRIRSLHCNRNIHS